MVDRGACDPENGFRIDLPKRRQPHAPEVMGPGGKLMRQVLMALVLPAALLAVCAPLLGQDEWMSEAEMEAAIREVEAQLDFHTGRISIGAEIATLDLPEGYRYLTAGDARYVLEELWGNVPDPEVLGLVVPAGQRVPVGWVIVVSYQDVGYVEDDDAGSIDFDDLLREMQKEEKEQNPEFRRQGYLTGRTLGWAEWPHYDSVAHKLYWARRLRFEGDPEITVNYDVRILGRRGILLLVAVGYEDEMGSLRRGCQVVLEGTEFTAGNRYEDFQPGVDKIAVYGIGGLIAGKLLLKTSILKLLVKPFIIVGALIAAFLGRIFIRRGHA
jgi:uncharacterized membrane-anchored protein